MLLPIASTATVRATGVRLTRADWHWDRASRTLTISLPRHTVHRPVTVTWR